MIRRGDRKPVLGLDSPAGIKRYAERVGIATSVWINVVTGGASNQTFSARNWMWKKQGKLNLVWIIDILLGENHCAECWVYWKVREGKW